MCIPGLAVHAHPAHLAPPLLFDCKSGKEGCNIWVGTGALDVQHVQTPLLVVPGRSNIACLWKQVDISEDIV